MALQKWNFDLIHSSINFSVRHLMVSKVRGRFHQWSGSLELDAENPSASRAVVKIDATSIDTREAKRDDHLRSPDFLEVEKFPTIDFVSTKVERKGDDRLALTGDLTIHGVTREVVLDVEHAGTTKDPWGGERTGFSASLALSRKDFGLTWNLALEAGGIVVGDKVEIELEIEAVKAVDAVASVAA